MLKLFYHFFRPPPALLLAALRQPHLLGWVSLLLPINLWVVVSWHPLLACRVQAGQCLLYRLALDRPYILAISVQNRPVIPGSSMTISCIRTFATGSSWANSYVIRDDGHVLLSMQKMCAAPVSRQPRALCQPRRFDEWLASRFPALPGRPSNQVRYGQSLLVAAHNHRHGTYVLPRLRTRT